MLGIIAAHDQLTANGQGCTASQRRLGKLAGCSESHVSDMVRDLRDWHYVASELRGRQRVHRVVWKNEVDRCFWVRDASPTGEGSDNAASDRGEVLGGNTSHRREQHFPQVGTILPKVDEKIGTSDSSDEDLRGVTYVLTEDKHIREKGSDLKVNEIDCAEARSRRNGFSVSEAESYLTDCEAMAASGDPHKHLPFERQQLALIADDACLPEAVADRARSLLGRIPEGR